MTDGNRDREAEIVRELDYQAQPADIERCRDELRLYAYQLIGSLRHADNLADDALLLEQRQWGSERWSPSLHDGLYASVTTRTLDVLSGCSHTGLPVQMQPTAIAGQPDELRAQWPAWLEPFPDELHPNGPVDSRARYGAREAVSLPFVVALQCLPPRQRAVLLLGAVRGWPVARIAHLLGVPARDVEQDLRRAEATMAASYDAEQGQREPPADETAPALLLRYVYAWETAHLDRLLALLADDVTLQLPPSPTCYEGRAAVAQAFAGSSFGQGDAARWRLLPRRANGQLAFGVYQLDGMRAAYQAHSIQLVTFSREEVDGIVVFRAAPLFTLFNLLPELPRQGMAARLTELGCSMAV